MNAATDRKLVEATLAGDTDAFTVLHRRYYARVYRLALFRCQNPSDAEDIAAETFVRAIAHLSTYRFQGESLFPWLSRICTNLVADMGRRRSPTALVSLDTPTADGLRALLEGMPGDAPDPYEMAERHETQALVRAAIASLPADQADAVLLRFLGDLSLKEIGAAIGKTEGAIKSLLHRAILSLRRTLLDGTQEAERFGQLRQGIVGNDVNRTGHEYGRHDIDSDAARSRRAP